IPISSMKLSGYYSKQELIVQIVKDFNDLNDSEFTTMIEQIKKICNVNEE
ncbi:7625_t:CDS:2, partial [Scutellospora calospora]